MAAIASPATPVPAVSARARQLGIDTGQEAVAYFRRDSPVVHSEGFESATRVWVVCGCRKALATVNVVAGLLEEVACSRPR